MDAILDFNMFLLEENAYKNFIAAANIRDLTMLNCCDPKYYVSTAFTWDESLEGEIYWADISHKWETHYQILKLLDLLRESCRDVRYAFTNRCCYKLHEIIKLYHPLAKAWFDGRNECVYTEVGGRFYNIKGEHRFEDSWLRLEK